MITTFPTASIERVNGKELLPQKKSPPVLNQPQVSIMVTVNFKDGSLVEKVGLK